MPRRSSASGRDERNWPTTRREEDYLEAIYTLQMESGVARPTEVSKMLGIRPACVTEMFQKLQGKELVEYKRYYGARLTPEGRRIGMAVKDRHDSLRQFLLYLDVQEPVASIDACTLEHYLSPETIMQIKRFNSFLAQGEGEPPWLLDFKVRSRQGRLP
ncbi:MAG: metal-dependent transcriptional regulator [Methanomassiliicoccales archaeon]